VIYYRKSLEDNLGAETYRDLMLDTPSTSRLSNNRNLRRITAELMNMLLNPFQRRSLVQKPSVRIATLRFELRTSQEAKCTKTIVQRHVYETAVSALDEAPGRALAFANTNLVAVDVATAVYFDFDEISSVIESRLARKLTENRSFRILASIVNSIWYQHIKIQTVFALAHLRFIVED
jgi:hypothetical protein